jgi:hypothetical protein
VVSPVKWRDVLMPGHSVSRSSFPSYEEWFLQNGPERSRARRFGAAQLTLDGEDRSETVYEEGKEER